MLMLFLLVFGIPSFVFTMVTAYLISNTFSLLTYCNAIIFTNLCIFNLPLLLLSLIYYLITFKVRITHGLRTIIILRIIKMAPYTCFKYLTRRVHKHPRSPPLCLRSLTGHRRLINLYHQRRGVRSVY